MKFDVPLWKLVFAHTFYDICKLIGLGKWCENYSQIIKDEIELRKEAEDFLNS